MKAHLVFPLVLGLASLPMSGRAISVLSSLNLTAQDSAEILDYTSNESTLLSTISRSPNVSPSGLGYGAQLFTLAANGQLVERGKATFDAAFGEVAMTNGVLNGTATVTVDATAGLQVGMTVLGAGLSAGTIVASVDSATSFTISPATGTSSTGVNLVGTNIGSVSTVAVDPLGRGFAAVALIPNTLTPGTYGAAPGGTLHNGNTVGKVAFFDYRAATLDANRALITLNVGFHPDHVKFTPDGKKLLVINEGERTTGGSTDAPGSITVIDLSTVTTAALASSQVQALTQAKVTTYDFQAANLGAGVSLTGLRYSEAGVAPADQYRHVEPEHCSIIQNTVYVTLQDNNAIAEFDLVTNKWTVIRSLGTITQKIDASDRDGPSAGKAYKVDDNVAGLPMPDQVGAFQIGVTRYLITANEGDARPDDGDVSRLSSANTDASLAPLLPESVMGRLNVSTVNGDTDNDGDIDVPTMFGTRSFTIWNAATGVRVFDSGSLEPLLAGLAPGFHNINDGSASAWDTRSDDKGPEPEAVAVGTFGSSTLAFIGLERQNGVLAYDVSTPTKPVFVGYINNLPLGVISPESLLFVPAASSPTGEPLLISGYEGTGAANTSGIVVHTDVVKFAPDEIFVYKVTNARNWQQDEVYYPGSEAPQPRNTRAGVVKDTSYLILNRSTRQIKSLRYFTRIEDGATLKEYTVEDGSYKPWDGILAPINDLEYLETVAPGVDQFTLSLKGGEALEINQDADLDGDGIMETGRTGSVSFLIGAAKPTKFGTGVAAITMPRVATTLAGNVHQVLDADFGDEDGPDFTDFLPIRQTYYRGSGAQTATLDTLTTGKVLTVDPAIGSGLVRGTIEYALSLVTAELAKLGYENAQP